MKVKRILLVIALLIFAVALSMQFRHHETEPICQGKTLTQWLKKYEVDSTLTNEMVCAHAIRTIGTNGIPTLLKLLDTKETLGFGKAQELVDRLGWKRIHWFDLSYKPRLGTIGFFSLGDAGKPAQTKLVELSGPDHSPSTQASALWCLEGIKADRQILVPLLVQNLTNQDRKLAGYAKQRLWALAPETMTNRVSTQTNASKK